MYLRIINNEIVYPYSLQKLREDNLNISFPSEMTETLMNEWDIFEVRQTPKPTDYTKNISEETPILIEGVYYQNWEQTNASESEINVRISLKWEEIRSERNELLKECDWTQLSDIPQSTKDAWTIYRQELRDITSQSNPFNITWPDKP
jgi:predicted mannosyl-3-phosphoglycerate phosphatase (HAD superfamily)